MLNDQYAKAYSQLKSSARENSMARGKNVLGSSEALPMYTSDVNLSSLPKSISNIYAFMRTETKSFYTAMAAKIDVTNGLLTMIGKAQSEFWGDGHGDNFRDYLDESNQILADIINKDNTEYYNTMKDLVDSGVSDMRDAIQDLTKSTQKIRDQVKENAKEVKEKKDKDNAKDSTSWLKSLLRGIGKGALAAGGAAVDLGVKYGVSGKYTSQILPKSTQKSIESAVNKLNNFASSGIEWLNSNTIKSSALSKFNTGMNEALKVVTKYGTTQLDRMDDLYEKQDDMVDNLMKNYGLSVSQARAEAARVMTRQGVAPYRKYTKEEQWERTFGARESAINIGFSTPQQISVAAAQIREMDEIMPNLNFQSSELYQTLIRGYEETGQMSQQFFDDIRSATKNLMVDPTSLVSVGNQFTKYYKIVSKGSSDFYKNMSNVMRVTAKLEDQFVDSSKAFDEMLGLGFSTIDELSDETIQKNMILSQYMDPSIGGFVGLQKLARTDTAAAVEAQQKALGSYLRDMGINKAEDITTKDLYLLKNIGVTGFDQISEALNAGFADLNESEQKLQRNQGVDDYTAIESGKQQLYYLKANNEMFGGFKQEWEKWQESIDFELLNNQNLRNFYDNIQNATYGTKGLSWISNSIEAGLVGGALFTKVSDIYDLLAKKFKLPSIFAKGGKGAAGAGAGEVAKKGLGTVGRIGYGLAGTAAIAYGGYEGYQAYKTLKDPTASSAAVGAEKGRMAGAGLAVAGGATSLIGGAFMGSAIAGPIGLAIAGVGAGAILFSKHLKEINDSSEKLGEELTTYSQKFSDQYDVQIDTYKNTADYLSNVGGVSSTVADQLKLYDEQLQNGTISSGDFDTKIRELANSDETGTLQALITATNNGSGDLKEAIGKLVSEDGQTGALIDYYTELGKLTEATKAQTEAVDKNITAVLKDDRNRELKLATEGLYEGIIKSDAFKKKKWGSIAADLISAGADPNLVANLQKGGFTKDEIKYLTTGEADFGADVDYWKARGGIDTTRLNDSGKYDEQFNVVAKKYGASSITTATEAKSKMDKSQQYLDVLLGRKEIPGIDNGWLPTIGAYFQNGQFVGKTSAIKSMSDSIVNYEKLVGLGTINGQAGWVFKNRDSEQDWYDKAKFWSTNPDKYPKIKQASTTFDASGYAGGSKNLGGASAEFRPAHAGGLNKVPYDNYLALLHKDERVLTAKENQAYTSRISDVFSGGSSEDIELAKNTLREDELHNELLTSQITEMKSGAELDKTSNILSESGNKLLSQLNKRLNDNTWQIGQLTIVSSKLQEILKPISNVMKEIGKILKEEEENAKKAAQFGETDKKDSNSGGVNDPFLSMGTKVTSPFGPRWGTFHYGQDYGFQMGTPLPAIMSGVITESGFNNGCGNYVVLQGDNGDWFRYLHMKEPGLPTGTQVNYGDIVGLCGSTGDSTGPHLHFETYHPGAKEAVKGNGLMDPAIYFDKYYVGGARKSFRNKIKQFFQKYLFGGGEGNYDVDLSFMRLLESGTSGIEGYRRTTVSPLGYAYGGYQFSSQPGNGVDTPSVFISWLKNSTNSSYRSIASTLGNGKYTGFDFAMMKSLWENAYDQNPNAFKSAQDAFEYEHYVKPALAPYLDRKGLNAKLKAVMAGHANWMGSGGFSSMMSRISGDLTNQKYMDAVRSYIRGGSNYGQFAAGFENRMNREAQYLGVHRNGLESVPYDGYQAVLHQGERVLTAPEAEAYRKALAEANAYVPEVPSEVYVDNADVVDRLETLIKVVTNGFAAVTKQSENTETKVVNVRKRSNSILSYT
jgi:murein DD-endopeptidase MepM/ murein hydrolase activator NlpD